MSYFILLNLCLRYKEIRSNRHLNQNLHVHQEEEIKTIIHDPEAGSSVKESCLQGQRVGKYPGDNKRHGMPHNEERTVGQYGSPVKKEIITK